MASSFAIFWQEAALDGEHPRAMLLSDDPESHGDILVLCNGSPIAHVSAAGELHPLVSILAVGDPPNAI